MVKTLYVKKSDVILVDGYNILLRHYAANPTLNANGDHVGGAIGMLKAVAKVVGAANPSHVIIAWEGGGSARRRKLLPEYKQNRRPVKLNRFYDSDEMPDTKENLDYQVSLIVKLFAQLPVCQVYVEGCEADDVIGYLAKYRFRGKQVTIVSSDKDFYQLVNDNTSIFRPTKKVMVGPADVLEEYGITPHNFCLAKAVVGDGSDNIGGVAGVGFKTLVKRIPALGEQSLVSVDDIISLCKAECAIRKHPPKFYSRIAENRDLIERNVRLMELDVHMFQPSEIKKTNGIVDEYVPAMNKLGLLKILQREGILNFDVASTLQPFIPVILRHKHAQ